MYTIKRTDASNPDFRLLVTQLDQELAIRDGEEHSFFAAFNKIDHIKNVVVIYKQGVAIGCGAIKEYEPGVMEIKRMFVIPEQRGKGIASLVLAELEKWAMELGYPSCILETGIKQPEAIRLYEKNLYNRIPNYGQYEHVQSSVCFQKQLLPA